MLTSDLTAIPVPDRYVKIDRIGEGSSSVVFRALDSEKDLVVALKQLRYPDSTERFNFKQEFRSLQDIYHLNIAQLYDLFDSEDHCFIAMELIDGTDFVSFARRSQKQIHSRAIETIFLPLRLALAHLIRGLVALHGAGKLHRDIKPTNVIVESSGRAVLVDFGLCTDLRPSRFQFETQSLRHAGTPAYMAPERLEPGSPVAEASDWYGVGAMLYEALVGEVPYPVEFEQTDGGFYDLQEYCRSLRQAQKKPPKPPHELNEKIPKDLSDLALSLLQWEADARPTDSEMSSFASPQVPEGSNAKHSVFSYFSKDVFVGRSIEEKKLQQAFRHSLNEAATVLVEGISGIGKTTLMEQFLSSVFESDGALILRSRCHPQEQVKYNAVDGLIDNLSTFLRRRQAYIADVSEENAKALSTVFPVLERVTPNQAIALSTDHQLVLQQAMAGLRQLLTKVTEDRPLVIWIDDAQWCDPTSLPVLREVFHHPQSPPNLLIISFRSEDYENNDVIKQLSGNVKTGVAAPVEHIKLLPLNREEIRSLVSKVEGLSEEIDDELLQRISEDTGGLPLFVIEWIYRYREISNQARSRKIDVSSVFRERVTSLPRELRDVLEIVAVSSRPVEEKTLIDLTSPTEVTAAALSRLCHQHLLRKTLLGGKWSYESYHDKIRGTTRGLLDTEDRRARHRQIADVLKKAPGVDPEILLEHYLGAEDRGAAADYAKKAALKALTRLAFERGAELFGLAVQLRGHKREDFDLLVSQAEAWANAGRTKKAARTYYKAALQAQNVQCERDRVTEIRVKAAEQALAGGFFQSGRKLLRGAFKNLELSFPTDPFAAHVLSIKNRVKFNGNLWLRRHVPWLETHRLPKKTHHGFDGPHRVGIHKIAPRDLRLDTLWVASRSMSIIDYVVGEAMTSWYLTEAVSQNEPSRLLRAFGLEASIYANIGRPWTLRRSDHLLQEAEQLLQGSRDEYDHAFLNVCRTSIEFVRGNWRSCLDVAQKTVTQYQEKVTVPQSAFRGGHWDITVTLGFELAALVFLGEFAELRHKLPQLLEDAERRGDRYRATVFSSSYTVFLPLSEDRPDDALRTAEELIAGIPSDQFISLHFHHFISKINALLYEGRAWEAWSLVEQRWPLFKNSWLAYTGCIGSHLRDLRARAALSAAKEEPMNTNWTTKRLLDVATQEANAIAKRHLPHAKATAASIRAGVAGIHGNSAKEKEQLTVAVSGFAGSDMKLHQAAGALALGKLTGGDEGAKMLKTSMEFFTAQGIKRPNAMAALLLPGTAQT